MMISRLFMNPALAHVCGGKLIYRKLSSKGPKKSKRLGRHKPLKFLIRHKELFLPLVYERWRNIRK